MIIMAANSAGIAGSQVFRTADAPLYVNAFTACLTMSAFVVVVTVSQGLWYYSGNRSLDAGKVEAPVVVAEVEAAAPGQTVEVKKEWRWTW